VSSEDRSLPQSRCLSWCSVDRHLHRILLKSLVGVVGLPIVIAVTVGVSALLASVGDRAAARVGAFVALAAGAAWVIVVVSAIVSASLAVLSLDADQRQLRRQNRRNERRRSRES
jgi:membrane protein implicated in regulation of membrane protease activity